MTSQPHVDPKGVFAALADMVGKGSTTREIYSAVCVAATLTIPGCDHASLMVSQDGARATVGVSDSIAHLIDKLELTLGMGPCIDALEMQTAQLDSDLAAGARWPELSARVLVETPVRGAMSIRMPVDRSKIGALNLFSDNANELDDASIEDAVVLGAFATIAINAAAHAEDVVTLRRGLSSNRAIGKAIGMLMVLNDISDADAFDLLRRTSQATNVKLADVAAGVVERAVLQGKKVS